MRKTTPTGVERGWVSLHTVTGLERRRRKGLEPSRRLSETTEPLHLSAFRVVVPAAQVTKRAARCKSAATFVTHGAPEPVRGPVRYLRAPPPPHMFRKPADRRTHVPATQRSAVRSPLLKALALRSPVTADAETGGASVTVASVAIADIGGVNGAAGDRAKHAARRGNGTVRTGAGTTADGRADAGARRSRHRRGRARRTPSRVRREAPTRALRKCRGQCGAVRTTAPDRGGKEERAAPLDDDATRDALWPMRRPGAPGYRAGGLCPQGCR